MTENTALSHMTPSLEERHGSVGVLLPNLECKVKDLLKAPIITHYLVGFGRLCLCHIKINPIPP